MVKKEADLLPKLLTLSTWRQDVLVAAGSMPRNESGHTLASRLSPALLAHSFPVAKGEASLLFAMTALGCLSAFSYPRLPFSLERCSP